MSSATETITALLEVLLAERSAIRRLDGAGVGHAAEAKEALVGKLAAHTAEEIAVVAGELSHLRLELRRNGILLAHARSCIDEVIRMTQPGLPSARRGLLRVRV